MDDWLERSPESVAHFAREKNFSLGGAMSASDEENVDIIFLEYSINGIQRIHVLLRNLRKRYPEALIIYIQHFSFRQKEVRKVKFLLYQVRKVLLSFSGISWLDP